MLSSRFQLATIIVSTAVLGHFCAETILAQERPQPTAEQQTQRFFERNDANKDNKLAKEELPEQFRQNFERIDADRNGFISLEEDTAFRAARIRRANQDRLPEGTTVLKDIPYVANGHEQQKLDLYIPPVKKDDDEAATKLPLVIWIHGGGWRNGDKQNFPARFLLNHGFAVASINYRLSSHAKFPAQIQDCQTAVMFLRQNAQKYSIDSFRFGAWGSSAGGHLVALLGTNKSRGFLEGKTSMHSSRVQAVCDYFGPIDFTTMNAQSGPDSRIDHDAENSPEALLLGGPVQDNKDAAGKASPATYISKGDPPFLIIHGDNDQLVPLQQSKDFHTALLKSDIDSTLHVVKDGGHGGFDETKRVLEFFERTLQSPEAYRDAVNAAMIFEVTFDGTTDANLFDEDGWIYTAQSMGRKKLEMGNRTKQVSVTKENGVSGDYLEFGNKTNQVLLYKAAKNDFTPRPDWAGSISFWLRLDPNKDLKPGFCDPLQIAQRKWNDGAIWVDFEDKKPRTFRLGVFSDFKVWNPDNKKFDDIPAEQKPMVTVTNPPFSKTKWTHVAITFRDINSTKDKTGTAKLYLDGELQGTIRQKFKISWTKPSPESTDLEPAIMLGLSYIGDMDELALFDRALSAPEVKYLRNSKLPENKRVQ